MRKEWVSLFRDDINQMVNLTITRMVYYILVLLVRMNLMILDLINFDCFCTSIIYYSTFSLY